MQAKQTARTASRIIVSGTLCDHRFDVAKIGQRYLPDVWICRFCGQRVRRKSASKPMNA